MNNKIFKELKQTLGMYLSNFSVEEADGKKYIFEGDTLEVGMEVSTYDENNNVVPLEDGEYTIKEKRVVIKDGKIDSFVEERKEEAPKDEEKTPTEELIAAITEAIKGIEDVEEAKKKVREIVKEEPKEEPKDKKPLANPLDQKTDFSKEKANISDNAKGTRFENVLNLFN